MTENALNPQPEMKYLGHKVNYVEFINTTKRDQNINLIADDQGNLYSSCLNDRCEIIVHFRTENSGCSAELPHIKRRRAARRKADGRQHR
jgi:hypothetical protein